LSSQTSTDGFTMSRLQPIGQKKLTNICVVRYKRCGKRFEVAAYRNTVHAWRNASENDKAAMLLSDEVLQARTIFANLEQGVEAKREDLIEAFGTDNEEAVCVEVLNKGEFQVERPCPAPWSSAAALPIRAACPVEPSSRLESTAAL
jgi:hypothetical protein